MMRKVLPVLLVIAMVPMFTGCGVFIKPYKKPILESIEPNETAFLIPLDGDVSKQAKFSSAEMLEKTKIATKRVEIPQRWVRLGRLPACGKWIPSARLIKVNRTPVARRWTPEKDTGTSTELQGLSAESKDSIGVTSGFAITGYIKEENSSTFLYFYPNNSLAQIIDNQIFNAAQVVYTAWSAKYHLDELRERKEGITEAMRTELIPKFAKQGITIDRTMGLIGGLYYKNPEIQQAIDDVFKAQTEEEKADALRLAQIKTNQKLLSVEQNEAEMRKVKADAEAYQIGTKAEAVKKGGSSYLELLKLEIELARIAKWKGEVPQFSGGDGGVMGHVISGQLPALATQ